MHLHKLVEPKSLLLLKNSKQCVKWICPLKLPVCAYAPVLRFTLSDTVILFEFSIVAASEPFKV